MSLNSDKTNVIQLCT